MPILFDETPQPETLEEAINVVYSSFNPHEVSELKKHGGVAFHMGAGMAMRNGWNLWGADPNKPTVLRDHLVERFGLGHGDDLSGLVLEGLTKKVKGEEYDPEVVADRYRAHWAKQSVDPLTQEEKPTMVEKVKNLFKKD